MMSFAIIFAIVIQIYFSNCAKASMASLAKDDKQCKYLYEYSKKAVIQHIK